ncbi:hypothetical protein niasHT_026691 [Heterodera trifolii]|uniref:Uncharacterized protein n=1 Tax=Heterodera trifolii TaxID=157864 RepID=A0ABD2JTB5_9BILA
MELMELMPPRHRDTSNANKISLAADIWQRFLLNNHQLHTTNINNIDGGTAAGGDHRQFRWSVVSEIFRQNPWMLSMTPIGILLGWKFLLIYSKMKMLRLISKIKNKISDFLPSPVSPPRNFLNGMGQRHAQHGQNWHNEDGQQQQLLHPNANGDLLMFEPSTTNSPLPGEALRDFAITIMLPAVGGYKKNANFF